MTVGIRAGNIISEVGAANFLNAFFATIGGLLDRDGDGERYPVVLQDLYAGHVAANKTRAACNELERIREELSGFPPSALIWDLDDRSLRPPWGDDISADITSLANYFVSSTGRDLFDLMLEVFAYADKKQYDVTIVPVPF